MCQSLSLSVALWGGTASPCCARAAGVCRIALAVLAGIASGGYLATHCDWWGSYTQVQHGMGHCQSIGNPSHQLFGVSWPAWYFARFGAQTTTELSSPVIVLLAFAEFYDPVCLFATDCSEKALS